jgi:hypothetical protein
MKSDHKFFDKNFNYDWTYDDREDKTYHTLDARISFFEVVTHYIDVDSASFHIYLGRRTLTSPGVYYSEKTTLVNAIKLAEKKLIEYAKEFVILSKLKFSD